MGGMGSGGWMRYGSKSTVDSQHAVDIRYLKKQGLLWVGNNGTLSWTCREKQTGAINYQVKENGIKLTYNSRTASTDEWQAVEQFVPFDYTPCHYGGKRMWLLCTGCNRRVACIYAAGKYFLCRHCYGLNFQSQHEDCANRQLTKAQEIRMQLGGSANMTIPFPEKPKGMHWTTYWGLQNKAMECELSYFKKVDGIFDRLSLRFAK